MIADLNIVRKDLLAACSEVREEKGPDVASEDNSAGTVREGNDADMVARAGETVRANGVQVANEAQVSGRGQVSDAGKVSDGAEAAGPGRAPGAPSGATGGLVPAFVALPGSTQEAAAVMRVAAEHELAVVVRGGGSRLSWGTPASRCDLAVDVSRMSGVVEHAAGDLVARVRVGTRMGDLAAVLARAGQEIALDVPGDATVGGVVASGLAGPRRLRYGTPRDLLIGITIVRADGTVAKSGGKVVKNVAGYDLGKLFAGSAGTLGLIAEATFRLHPLPAARAYATAEYVAVSVACDAVAAAANSALVASAVEMSRADPGGPIRVGVLFEGSANGVEARSMRMADLLGKGEVSADQPAWWPDAPQADTGETLIRVSFWVSALARVLDAIEASAAKTGVAPVVEGSAGAGLLYIRVRPSGKSGSIAQTSAAAHTEGANEPEGGGSADHGAVPRPDVTAEPQVTAETQATAETWRTTEAQVTVEAGVAVGAGAAAEEGAGAATVAWFVDALRGALAGERGAVAVLAAPAGVRGELAGRGGMSGTVPGLALMRAVKEQFDPGHRMAPGRFPEGA